MTTINDPSTAIATLGAVVLDCSDPYTLSAFYSQILGLPADPGADASWTEIKLGGGLALAFQQIPDHVVPTWPGGSHPQQFHLDFDVPDLDDGERRVLALGATKDEHQPGTTFRVFRDPAGHPFCLCQAG